MGELRAATAGGRRRRPAIFPKGTRAFVPVAAAVEKCKEEGAPRYPLRLAPLRGQRTHPAPPARAAARAVEPRRGGACPSRTRDAPPSPVDPRRGRGLPLP